MNYTNLIVPARAIFPDCSQDLGVNIKFYNMTKQVNEESSSKNATFKIKVDNDTFSFNTKIVNGEQILIKAGKTPVNCFTLYQKLKGCDFEKVSLDETVDLSEKGIEKFTVKEAEVFHYLLDDEPETTDKKSLTANQILELGGILPVTDYYLMEIEDNGNEISHKDSPNAPILMKCPSSKFVSIFRGAMPVS